MPAEQLASAVGYNATSDDDSVSLTKKAAATSTSTSSTDIGAEKAKEIALQHAGVSASNAVFVKAERERDDGRLTYDVDFYAGNKEYDYEILAADGTILSYDADIEGYRILPPPAPPRPTSVRRRRKKSLCSMRVSPLPTLSLSRRSVNATTAG